MTTVIDSLIVELGLDPKGFTKGQKDAAAAMVKTKDDANKAAKEMEEAGKRAAQFFSQLRGQVIALFAAFTAGKGIKEFVSDIVSSDAATGRLAKTTGTMVEALSAWRGLVVLAGGSAAGIAGSIQGLVQQFQQFSLTGESSVIPYFRALGVNISDDSGKMRDMSSILLDLADRFSHMDPAKAAAFGKALGLDEGTINVLIQGREAVEAMLKEQERLGVVTAEQARAAAELQRSWGGLEQSSSSLGRMLITAFQPVLVKVVNALTDIAVWARDHKPFVEAAFTALAAAAIALAIAFSPISLGVAVLIAALVALGTEYALIYDDWVTWTEGGEALFGDFFNFIAALFTGSSEDIRNTWNALFGGLSDKFSSFIDSIKELAPKILEAFQAAFMGAITWVENRVNAVWGAIFGKKLFSSSEAGNTPSKPSQTVSQGQDDVAKLMGMGWTKEQAQGISANLQRESGGNPSAVGDNGKAYGLAQWHPDRQANFEKWSGHSIQGSSRDEQLAFVNYELRQGSEQRAGRALSGASDPGEAASIVSRLYERPADGDGESKKRAALASAMGAPGAATTQASYGGSSSTSTSDVRVGQVIVNTQATDADGIAKEIGPAIERNSFSTQANYGPA